MKILLVNPPNDNPMTDLKAIEPPVWCALLASHHRRCGKDVTIWDAEVEPVMPEMNYDTVIIVVVMGSNPSVSSTPKMPKALEITDRLQSVSAKYITLTGLHLMSKDGWKDYYSTEGILNGQALRTLTPAWDLIDFSKYRAHNWHCLDRLDQRGHYGVIYTSFGCPFDCFYCNIRTLYGESKVHYRPIPDVVAELEVLVHKYGVRNLKIADECFTLNKQRTEALCEAIASRDYGLNIWAYGRGDTVNPAMLRKMKRAGINWVAYGFETSKEDKFRAKNGDIVKMTRDAGINIMANFLFGLPSETEDDWKASLEMAIRENFQFVNFYVALPYPGSRWYESLENPPTDWSSYNQFSTNICADPEVVRFRDEGWQTYITRPEYLSMIKSKFGEKAESHIKELAHRRFR